MQNQQYKTIFIPNLTLYSVKELSSNLCVLALFFSIKVIRILFKGEEFFTFVMSKSSPTYH